MDLNRLRQGEQIAAIAAIVLLLDMFIFKWFGLKVSGTTPLGGFSAEGSKNAWGSFSFIDIVLFITVLAALGMAYLTAADLELDLPIAASVIVAVLGGLSTILVLIRLISPPDFGVDVSGIDHTRKIGAFIGLIAAAALTYGAWRAMQDEGASFQRSADRLRDRGGPGTGGYGGGEPAPPPPSSEPPSAPPPPPPPPPSGTPPSA
jgi:hypothetical protein